MKSKLTPPQKAAINLGLLQLSAQLTEELIEDGFGKVFTGTIKNDAKKMVRHFDNCIGKICALGDIETREQTFDMYSYLVDIVDSIDWNGDANNKIKK